MPGLQPRAANLVNSQSPCAPHMYAVIITVHVNAVPATPAAERSTGHALLSVCRGIRAASQHEGRLDQATVSDEM